eukprot:3008013-Pleurochrysis_carterae.AAC.1
MGACACKTVKSSSGCTEKHAKARTITNSFKRAELPSSSMQHASSRVRVFAQIGQVSTPSRFRQIPSSVVIAKDVCTVELAGDRRTLNAAEI